MASLMATPVSDWLAACATIIKDSNITTGLVDQHGSPMSVFNNFTWGIDRVTCYEYCGKETIYQVSLSVAFTVTADLLNQKKTHKN